MAATREPDRLGAVLEQAEVDRGRLHSAAVGTFSLTTLGVASVVGAGIFVTTGEAASEFAGPAVVIFFVLAGVAAALTAVCSAEFAAMIPIAGSTYSYAHAAFGTFLAWFIGWDLLLEYLFAASTVAVGWAGYAVSFLGSLGISVPHDLANPPSAPIRVPSTFPRSSSSSPRARCLSRACASPRAPTTRWSSSSSPSSCSWCSCARSTSTRRRRRSRPTVLCGAAGAVVAGLTPISVLGDLVSIGTLLAFVIVCAGVLVLRRSHPDVERPFRVAHVNVVASLGILSALALMVTLPATTWLRLLAWLAIGLVIFFGYARHHVRLRPVP